MVGGYDPSLAPMAYADPASGVDFVVRGEGELTVRALVRALEGNGDVRAIAGLSHREGDELRHVMATCHVLGVRSRTKVRAEHLALAARMLAIGCFSVGTDQVDITAAAHYGIPVFNAPHASTRSVAELTLGCIVALARRLGDKSAALHGGMWDKSLAGAHEVRGRSVGISRK
jgi:phosphoglycerate dehydrogenase-like enzyme